jgi:hypothetical protein
MVGNARRRFVTGLLLGFAVLSAAPSSSQAPLLDLSKVGPQVGQSVPDFAGIDQFGRRHTLRSSLGSKGAMLVFFRSADW